MDPSEVQVEQVANKLVTCTDSGPWNFRRTWAKTSKAIITRALYFEVPDNVYQAMVSWRLETYVAEVLVLYKKPGCNLLMRVASSKPPDDFDIVPITPNCLQDYPPPVTRLLQVSISVLAVSGHILDFFVPIYENCIVPTKILDLSYQIILMCFCVGFVDTFIFTLSTSATGRGSKTITLEGEGNYRLALDGQRLIRGGKTSLSLMLLGKKRFLTRCLAVLQGVQAI